jgi:hypothetical protein
LDQARLGQKQDAPAHSVEINKGGVSDARAKTTAGTIGIAPKRPDASYGNPLIEARTSVDADSAAVRSILSNPPGYSTL